MTSSFFTKLRANRAEGFLTVVDCDGSGFNALSLVAAWDVVHASAKVKISLVVRSTAVQVVTSALQFVKLGLKDKGSGVEHITISGADTVRLTEDSVGPTLVLHLSNNTVSCLFIYYIYYYV